MFRPSSFILLLAERVFLRPTLPHIYNLHYFYFCFNNFYFLWTTNLIFLFSFWCRCVFPKKTYHRFPHPCGQAHPFQGLPLVFLRALLIKNIFTQLCSVYYFWANEVLRPNIREFYINSPKGRDKDHRSALFGEQ